MLKLTHLTTRVLLCSKALVIGTMLLAQASHAADQNGKFSLKGAGMLPCKVFVQEREIASKPYYLIGGWIEGYVSAHNKLMENTYDVTSFESLEMLLTIVNNHCQASSNDLLHAVVDNIILKLADEKLQQADRKIEIKHDNRATYLYVNTVKKIQTQLASLGLYKGNIHGMFDESTQTALALFQDDIGFEDSGFPDQATLWRLLRQRDNV